MRLVRGPRRAPAPRLAAPLLDTPPTPGPRQFDGHPVRPTTLLHPHTDFAHRYWAGSLRAGDAVVDATCGNGHDAAFLALALGRAGGGSLHCIDVQPLALENSQARLREALERDGWDVREDEAWRAVRLGAEITVHWVLGCHADALEAMAAGSAALIVFNLGYLPGGDRSLTTTAEGTLRALRAAERACAVGGCVSATLYPGHAAGVEEEAAVLEHAASLEPQGHWSVYHTQWLNQRNKRNGRRAPSLVLLQHVHD